MTLHGAKPPLNENRQRMRADLAEKVARLRARRRRHFPLGAEPRRPALPIERPAPRVHKQQLQHKDKRMTGHVKEPDG